MRDFYIPTLKYTCDADLALDAEQKILSGQYTQKDAETMLSWNHAMAYQLMQNAYDVAAQKDSAKPQELELLHPEKHTAYEGWCGRLSNFEARSMQDMNVACFIKNMDAMAGGRMGHAFCVTHFSSDDFQKSYLVDHSLVQFFLYGSDRKMVHPDNPYDAVLSHAFVRNKKSTKTAKEILTRGWTELSDDVMHAYCYPFVEAGSCLQNTLPRPHDRPIFSRAQIHEYILNDQDARGAHRCTQGFTPPSQY